MSVTVQIKQKSIFKKKLNIDDIINLTGLSYGVSDENFRLIRDEKANHTLIYDKTKLARGIDLWLEGTDIMLLLSLPTSSSEIKLFYNVIEKICNKSNISKYLRDDVQVNICDNKKYIKYDEDTSVVALEDIEAKTGDSYQRFELFGVFNPISIGQNELKKINHNLDNFEKFLNEIQSLDVYYSTPSVYKNTNTNKLFGVYSIVADIPCVVPTKPYIILNQNDGIEDWYVMVRKGKTIKYIDFINNIKTKNYYDANHIIGELNDKEINDLLDKYDVEL